MIMSLHRNFARAVGVLSPQSRPSNLRTLNHDELTFLRKATSQHIEIARLKQITADDVSKGVDREYGKISKFHQQRNDKLTNHNDKLRDWLDTWRKTSAHYHTTATKAEEVNAMLKSKIRKLEADLERSEKDRQRENARHADELKSNDEENAAKVAELDRHFGELKTKHEQALVPEKSQELEARMSRAKKLGDRVDRVQTKLNKAAEENQEQTGKAANLDRRYKTSQKSLQDQTARADSLQSEVDSLTAKTEKLGETVLKDNKGEAKTIESRAKQMATEMADHRVKVAHDSTVKEGQRLLRNGRRSLNECILNGRPGWKAPKRMS
ncbi:hypothetical protein OEA41_005043 [Lepraria neglecta]|uniref:Uncharacterized protein n=1 Tax=Lepraria neglecta TaxID=209136 RepID=A0AAE0DGP1_9LECA|nr:hypothetical protein OEA41_005043 [Lepraria neglecta]